jgi:hypothetical protein
MRTMQQVIESELEIAADKTGHEVVKASLYSNQCSYHFVRRTVARQINVIVEISFQPSHCHVKTMDGGGHEIEKDRIEYTDDPIRNVRVMVDHALSAVEELKQAEESL